MNFLPKSDEHSQIFTFSNFSHPEELKKYQVLIKQLKKLLNTKKNQNISAQLKNSKKSRSNWD